MRKHLLMLLAVLITMGGCGHKKEQNIIIFHAGSLTVPVKKINEAFERYNPGVRVLSEAAGSLASARKVTELNRPCDIVLSADYFVIDKLLIPGHASWNLQFATNEIVLAYRQESKYSGIINEENWPDILLRSDVIYGRSDPGSDPCGYRTVFVAQLAEGYYDRPGLADSLLEKNRDYIRPKEVDLVALAQTGAIDYMFQYKSVAVQHGLAFLVLPPEINLSDPALNELYRVASCQVPGSEPGQTIEARGEYITYSGTVLDKAPNRELALRYFAFMLSPEGRDIFSGCGQEPLVPCLVSHTGSFPELLKPFTSDTISSTPGTNE